jgi:tRNA(Ile)-lysidine synthase
LAWTNLHAQIHQTLTDRGLLPSQSKILVAVSGGQDSLCLGQLLKDLQPKWRWHIVIGHCDHGWAQDVGIANHVSQIAARWELPFELETTHNLPETEVAAREWRYQALITMAQRADCSYLVTAHTQTDRAETLLYNLIRGAGADGLSALSWTRSLTSDITLVRPLLEISRTTTGQFCQSSSLTIWDDVYNHNPKYARNRLREKIIPQIAANFHPQVESHLAHTAELLRAEVEYLESLALELYDRVSREAPESAIDRVILRSAPLALQRRVMRHFLQQHLGKMPTFHHIEDTISLITAPNRTRTSTLSQGLTAQADGQWIVITSN